MQNHVRNVIKMKGITELPLFQTYDDESKGFDFNKLIPMPEILKIDSGSMVEENAIYYLTEKCTIPLSRLSKEKRKVLDKLIERNMFGSEKWSQETFNKVMEKSFDAYKSKREKMYIDGKTY